MTQLTGKGTYGAAYRSENLGEPISIKRSKPLNAKNVIPAVNMREICLLSEPKYKHIIHPQTIFYEKTKGQEDGRDLCFSYEYGAVDVNKLRNYITKSHAIDECVAKSIIFQLLLALNHLHQRGINHCDITPSNLIIMPPKYEHPGILKLIDFGLSRTMEWQGQERSTVVVTVWYRSPELLLDYKQYNSAVDIWSAGCIFAELLTGKVLFYTKDSNQEQNNNKFCSAQMETILNIMGNFDEDFCNMMRGSNYYPQFNNLNRIRRNPTFDSIFNNPKINRNAVVLLRQMLEINPAKRISAYDALRHPYFNESPIPRMNIAKLFSEENWKKLEEVGGKSEQR